jgi:hypothetical protein
MKKLLFILLLTIPFIGFGQGWEKTFGGGGPMFGEIGNSVQQTNDGGYIITGWTFSFGNGNSDVYLIKTDVNGVEQWSQTFGGTGWEEGRSVQQTTDGGYIICGDTESFGNGNGDVYLIKTNGNGVEQWSQTFGGTDVDRGRSVQQTNDGGYIICGSSYSTGNGEDDVYLIKTNGNGVEQWSQTFGGTENDRGHSVQQTNDGGYIICGYSKSIGIGLHHDFYLIKLDGNGNQIWDQIFPQTNESVGFSVRQTNDGGYIFTGHTETYGVGDGDVYLIKTNGNGVEQWSQTFGGTGYDGGYSVQQTNDGGYIITGWTFSFGNGNGDVYLIKTNGNGVEQWSQTFGGTGYDGGYSVQQTNDGGYIICGEKGDLVNGTEDVYLIKTDSQGSLTSTFNIPTLSSKRKLVKIFDVLGRETKLQTNTPFIEIYDDGSTEKKLIIEK